MSSELATRKIVLIDEEKCNGCGECVPSCAEGAIQVVDGKARLLAENLCDGLGNCLGTCPQDAITIEERSAEDFDEAAVERLKAKSESAPETEAQPAAGGCPGAMMRMLGGEKAPAGGGTAGPAAPKAPAADAGSTSEAGGRSQLQHWPVQLALLPEAGRIWQDADVLLAADCAAYAMGDFHDRLLAGRRLAIACPKLDDARAYAEKLARIFAGNDIRSLTIARMEVPCCGLDHIVQQALQQAGKPIPLTVVIVSTKGEILEVDESKAAT